jgi:hypothetical protein
MEKVKKLGIRREPHFMYYLKGDQVWRTQGEPIFVVDAGFEREEGYLYFLDQEGDISRAPRPAGAKTTEAKKTDAPPRPAHRGAIGEKVAAAGIERRLGFLYFIRGNEVWRIAGPGPGATSTAAPERVAAAEFRREPGYFYFLDADGDVARVRRDH